MQMCNQVLFGIKADKNNGYSLRVFLNTYYSAFYTNGSSSLLAAVAGIQVPPSPFGRGGKVNSLPLYLAYKPAFFSLYDVNETDTVV